MPTAARPDQYRRLYDQFRWHVPEYFNIGQVCCDRWASGNRVAIRFEDEQGKPQVLTYRELQRQASRLANALRALGVQAGDRVAIVLPQRPETAIAHLAIHRLGAIAMPMSILFGPLALMYRYQDSEAVAAIIDAGYLVNTRSARPDSLKHVVVVGNTQSVEPMQPGEFEWRRLIGRAADQCVAHPTRAVDPAVLVYTSGTTGPPKGALMPHRALIGNLTGFVASQNWFPQDGDVFWSPADWAWTGGLMDALLPTLYFGKSIVGYNGRFGPEKAYELLEKYQVTNSFLFPTALKQMMKAEPEPMRRRKLRLRAIMSAGESVGETLFDWCRSGLNVTVNEMFGQTEVNYIVGNSSLRWPARGGSIGRPYPGHRVAVIDDAGKQVRSGELGEVAVNRFDHHGHADPVFFLEYWRNPSATEARFSGDWCRTGDLAMQDRDGCLWYRGRADDMFKAAGYRIGPGEIENCLIKHPAVANVAVVPKPDAQRGNLVKAYVVLAPGHQASGSLINQLQDHVRGKLAPYQYPKEIEFIEALPMTTTGKVQRGVLRLQEEERSRTP